MKHLENTPDFICKPGDNNYVSYVDTDSVYIHAEPLLKFLFPDFEEKTEEDKDEVLSEVALKYQDIITESYDELALNCFNVKTHRLEMKTEAVIRAAYFRATRRYAQWISRVEGRKKDFVDVKGLEFKKANFPPVLGKFFNKLIMGALKGADKAVLNKLVKDFRQDMLDGTLSYKELGNPTAVKTLNKYSGRKARAGELFSVINKGAPASVRASIIHNDLLTFWGIKDHNFITQSDKVKWVYLKPNSFRIEALAFLEYDVPEKIEEFILKFLDREKTFSSILLNKLEGLYGDLEMDLMINEYKNKFFKDL